MSFLFNVRLSFGQWYNLSSINMENMLEFWKQRNSIISYQPNLKLLPIWHFIETGEWSGSRLAVVILIVWLWFYRIETVRWIEGRWIWWWDDIASVWIKCFIDIRFNFWIVCRNEWFMFERFHCLPIALAKQWILSGRLFIFLVCTVIKI